MSAPKKKIYGIADRAWQPVVGCDPKMPCAPRCWARKTIARICECQGNKTRDVFQIALTPDGKKWSGVVSLDEAHLTDPLKWRKPALIAAGFHGDWGRLDHEDQLEILRVIDLSRNRHKFLLLTKQPQSSVILHEDCIILPNVSIGCSVMNQAEADKYHKPTRRIAGLGWATHVWYEPAIGPVDWVGWEFLGGIIAGGESGANSRPAHPQWFRYTRDWCERNGIAFNFKQWGDWAPSAGKCFYKGPMPEYRAPNAQGLVRVGKKLAGRTLDGRTHDGIPRFGNPGAWS